MNRNLILAAVVVFVLIAAIFAAHAMGSTQFGTYTQAYLDRQKCKADAKAAGTSEELCRKPVKRRP